MKVNVYDFDGTIYDGDSSIDFYKFCLRRNKILIFYIFPFLFSYILYFIKIYDKTRVKETFFKFIKFIDLDIFVKDFWEQNEYKIKKFYKNKSHINDIIISASPIFLLSPICNKMKVKDLIASDVDKFTGKFLSKNCKGEEKVKRLFDKYPNAKIENMYTDSYIDTPLMSISRNSYLVKKNRIVKIQV